jgi:chitinase
LHPGDFASTSFRRYVGKLAKDSTGQARAVLSGLGGASCTVTNFSQEDVEIVERMGSLVADLMLTEEKVCAVMMQLQQKMGRQ